MLHDPRERVDTATGDDFQAELRMARQRRGEQAVRISEEVRQKMQTPAVGGMTTVRLDMGEVRIFGV